MNEQTKQEQAVKSPPLAFTIVFWVVVGIAVLALLIHFLFHPIDRLKLGMLLTQSYEITVSQKPNGVNPVTHVLADRDVICVVYNKNTYELPFGMGLSPDRVYYESTKDGVWKYSHYPTGEWKRTQTDFAQITLGTGTDSADLDMLLDKRNYQRNFTFGDSFSLKDDIEIDGLIGATFYKTKDGYTLQLITERGTAYILFSNVGRTRVTLPEEAQE